MVVQEFSRGSKRWIVGVPGAHSSFHEAVANVPGNRNACPSQLVRYVELLSNGVTSLSSQHYRHEGDQIYAIKARCGLRAYGWYSTYLGEPAFVISHVILKKWDDFRDADRQRVLANRKVYEASQRSTR